MFLAIPEYLPCIQARAFLRGCSFQVTMPYNLRLREELVKVDKQVLDSLVLLRSQGIARLALLIQPSLVADADGATVVGAGVGTDLQQHSMLRLRAILADIEVIADVSEATSLVVAA